MSGEPDKGVVETSTLPPSSSDSNEHSADLASHNIQPEPLEDYHSRSHASSISNHDEEKHDHYDEERNDPVPEPLHRASTVSQYYGRSAEDYSANLPWWLRLRTRRPTHEKRNGSSLSSSLLQELLHLWEARYSSVSCSITVNFSRVQI